MRPVCLLMIFLLLTLLYFHNLIKNKLITQVVGIPMGTNCAPLVTDLFLFCYARGYMMSLSDDKQADVVDAFNSTSRYLDDILNINYVYFDNMVSQIYLSERQLYPHIFWFEYCFPLNPKDRFFRVLAHI